MPPDRKGSKMFLHAKIHLAANPRLPKSSLKTSLLHFIYRLINGG
jgi:hypothetical protein